MPKKPRNDLTAEYVRSRLDYNPDTGELTRKPIDQPEWGNWWNSRFAGRVAGGLHPNGYVRVKLDNRLYNAHRLIWLYMMGEWPEEVDHINGVKSDNRWANLREATRKQNSYNILNYNTNTSGYKNVMWDRRAKKWAVRVQKDGYLEYFGLYEDIEEAAKVAKKAREELHGDYANHG